jgi:hypothetical protein
MLEGGSLRPCRGHLKFPTEIWPAIISDPETSRSRETVGGTFLFEFLSLIKQSKALRESIKIK